MIGQESTSSRMRSPQPATSCDPQSSNDLPSCPTIFAAIQGRLLLFSLALTAAAAAAGGSCVGPLVSAERGQREDKRRGVAIRIFADATAAGVALYRMRHGAACYWLRDDLIPCDAVNHERPGSERGRDFGVQLRSSPRY